MKTKITEYNYKQIVLKRAIISCWILLAICFFIKIFGGNFFNIVCRNENFIKICKFIDDNIYLLTSFVFYMVTNCIYLYSFTKATKISTFIILISLPICFLMKYINMTMGIIFDILVIEILLPVIFMLKEKHKPKKIVIKVLIAFMLINLFQVISMFVKNLGLFKVLYETSLVSIIYSIDYIIMLTLHLLYSKK